MIDQIDTLITMKLTQSARQTTRWLIIFLRTCTSPILYWTCSYAGSSNCGRFGEIFWRIKLGAAGEADEVHALNERSSATHSIYVDQRTVTDRRSVS